MSSVFFFCLNGLFVKSDEVGALVFDPGHYSFRAGFAGEEVPKVIINIFFYTVLKLCIDN